MKHITLAIVAGLSLAACETTSGVTATQSAVAPAWLSIIDKTIVSGDTNLVLGSNGALVGDGVEGVWEERDGKFCRTLSKPERLAGTECQVVTLSGNEVTFESPSGRTSTWVVQ